MQIKDLKSWLERYNDNDEVQCWIKIGEYELSEPNMATMTVKEIFDFEDKINSLDYDRNNKSNNMTKLFLLCNELLDELEGRLQLDPEFIKEMEEMHEKIEKGDTSDFVEVEIPEFTLWDKINDLYEAQTIEEYVESSERVITHITDKINNIDCYIDDSNVFLEPIDNASLSTSIIADLLDIEARDIDDRMKDNRIWKIPVIRR